MGPEEVCGVFGISWSQLLGTFAAAAVSAYLFVLVSFSEEGPVFRTAACARTALMIIGITAAAATAAGLGLTRTAPALQPLVVAFLAPGVLSTRRVTGAGTEAGDAGRLETAVTLGLAALLRRLAENLGEAANDWAESMVNRRWTIRQLEAAGRHYYDRLHARVDGDPVRAGQVDADFDQFTEALCLPHVDVARAHNSLRIMLERAYRWGGHHWQPYQPPSRRSPPNHGHRPHGPAG
jgi:hypothetical protein